MNAKIRFRRKFPSKCNKPIVKWYKPHGAIQFAERFFRLEQVNRFFLSEYRRQSVVASGGCSLVARLVCSGFC